jgi:NitT/TauT family transport system substrate-binding protein
MTIRILATRHSPFYTPIFGLVAAGFLEREGLSGAYSVRAKGERWLAPVREERVEIVQNAVASSWPEIDRGEMDLPVHFAQLNQRDGFFLISRQDDPQFDWKKLEGKEVMADSAGQPLVMLQYAAHRHGVDWSKIRLLRAAEPEEMLEAFRAGKSDYIHLQAPGPQQLEEEGIGFTVAAVGDSLPPVAFNSLCCSRKFLESNAFAPFLRAFLSAKEWACSASPEDIVEKVAPYFPAVSTWSLVAAIGRYQKLEAWSGGVAIPRECYEQALDIYRWAGKIQRRYAYEEVCIAPPSAM